MEDLPSGSLTRLLRDHRAGDANAFGRLVELAHGELEKMAKGELPPLPGNLSPSASRYAVADAARMARLTSLCW